MQTDHSPDSDEVSSLDSITESLKSEDVFAGAVDKDERDDDQDTQGKYNLIGFIF